MPSHHEVLEGWVPPTPQELAGPSEEAAQQQPPAEVGRSAAPSTSQEEDSSAEEEEEEEDEEERDHAEDEVVSDPSCVEGDDDGLEDGRQRSGSPSRPRSHPTTRNPPREQMVPATAVDPEDAGAGDDSEDEDTSMRGFMKSLKKSLRSISTKQDVQHDMITDLRDKLEIESATRTSEIRRLEERMGHMRVSEPQQQTASATATPPWRASQAAAQRAAAMEANRERERRAAAAAADAVLPSTPIPQEKATGSSQEKQLRKKKRRSEQDASMEVDAKGGHGEEVDPLVANDAWMRSREAELQRLRQRAEEDEAEEFVREMNQHPKAHNPYTVRFGRDQQASTSSIALGYSFRPSERRWRKRTGSDLAASTEAAGL